MNLFLTFDDFLALSPQLCILIGVLSLLLFESFAPHIAKKLSLALAGGTLLFAGILTMLPVHSINPLLMTWLRFDQISETFSLLAYGAGVATLCLSSTFFVRFHVNQAEYCVFLLCAIFGIQLIAHSADFLTLFLGLEILSVSTYVLCGYAKKWTSANEAALKYFLMGSFASALFLYGVALIYGAVGHTSLNSLLDAYHSILEAPERTLFLGGISLVSAGLFFKAAIVPFHFWSPDVYAGAPTPVSGFMALGIKVAAFAALVRVFWGSLQLFDPLWNKTVQCLIYITLIYANYLALRQTQLRRFFAYSGISHAGFLLIPLVVDGPAGWDVLWIYLVVYLVATAGAFATLAVLDSNSKGACEEDLKGLFQESPLIACGLSLSLLTLAGFPPTAGFFAKFALFQLAYAKGYYDLVLLGLAASLLSAFYYFRWIAVMLEPKEEKHKRLPCVPEKTLSVACIIIIGLISLFPRILL